ncbi:MAG TPA: hypothetical protein VK121_03295 [Pseudogracilibacillus sp.]|nr:hypothetical protein [Pseudogracilibacillus sp.]
MLKSIPIIVIAIGVVFVGITVQNLIKFSVTEVSKEKEEWKKTSIVFLSLSIVSIIIGIILIKII